MKCDAIDINFTCWAAFRRETGQGWFLDAATIRPTLHEARKRASEDSFGGRNPVLGFVQVRVVLTGEMEKLRCTCPTSLVEDGWPHEAECPEQ